MTPRILPHTVSFIFIIATIALTGCTKTTVLKRSDQQTQLAAGTKVLLMPPDIELSELTIGGLLEPKADWTAQAKTHVTTALKDALEGKTAQPIVYQPPKGDPEKEHTHDQLVKLHDAVGGAIIASEILGHRNALPTKEGKLDWSLGKGTNILREDYGTDYGLFILIRDSYASAGRMVLAATGGRHVGFASLVDLRTGDILWVNWLTSGVHDVRAPEPARKAVMDLLADFPL